MGQVVSKRDAHSSTSCPYVHSCFSKRSFSCAVWPFAYTKTVLGYFGKNHARVRIHRNSVCTVVLQTGKTELLACDNRFCAVIFFVSFISFLCLFASLQYVWMIKWPYAVPLKTSIITEVFYAYRIPHRVWCQENTSFKRDDTKEKFFNLYLLFPFENFRTACFFIFFSKIRKIPKSQYFWLKCYIWWR